MKTPMRMREKIVLRVVALLRKKRGLKSALFYYKITNCACNLGVFFSNFGVFSKKHPQIAGGKKS